ncbi:DUF2071 domain-containing protein [Ferruginibacter sp.]|uniref:DUF2071 domain-containing protein n=1 Tax=Ferruginibacter sp. TaxID=1940288 RepID=UPI001990C9BE|nr:DUF2071 domain-containing protein [Ferruginibacter sp.]MBC7627731.1 DUF2071 domain-containing protein [Ferruginibacter sp.]
MKIPTIQGIIDRRILINFTADPEIIKQIIPAPFRPKVYNNKAIVGICLIRLKKIRPKGFPGWAGISSENGAHRIAVEWTENDEIKTGVYIPRRDTSSLLNSLAGGRIFPGLHYHAAFTVKEENGHYQIAFKSSDGTTISIDAKKSDHFNPNSIFQNLATASAFFEGGAVGYSPDGDKFEGLQLSINNWKVEALEVTAVESSFFENENIFPKGSVIFDNALLMTQIKHEWHSIGQKSNRL